MIRIRKSIKDPIRTLLRSLELDVLRASENTNETWLGLKNRDFRCVIDVGANEGQFAQIALKHFPNAQIHCFEPLRPSYDKLEQLAMTDEKRRIKTHCLALGETKGMLQINLHVDHAASSSFLEATEKTQAFCPAEMKSETQLIRVSTLDEVILAESLQKKPVLLKIDVQGFEDRVLKGGTKTLTQVDAVLIEVNFATMYHKQATFRDIVCLLDDAGLNYSGNIGQIYDKDLSVLWSDCVFLRHQRAS